MISTQTLKWLLSQMMMQNRKKRKEKTPKVTMVKFLYPLVRSSFFLMLHANLLIEFRFTIKKSKKELKMKQNINTKTNICQNKMKQTNQSFMISQRTISILSLLSKSMCIILTSQHKQEQNLKDQELQRNVMMILRFVHWILKPCTCLS